MSNAADLRAELKAALMDGATDRATGLEWCRAVDVAIDAAVREAHQLSPATSWLNRPGRRLTGTVIDGRAHVRLLDVADKRGVVSVEADGETIEEAMANALNKVFSQS